MIGERIRKERLQRGWSQENLADKLGMTKNAVSSYETEKTEPNIEILKRLSNIFDCTIDYLTGVSDDKDSVVYAGVRNGDTIKVHIHKNYPHNLTPEEVESLLDNLVDAGFNIEKLIEKAKSNQ
ncbi:helix-turn-helix domain-containing protein [Niameybacter massiliensis]|uniref:helix-turn-helix domain-containing protein n=1 Tax=Niameybacter massiliensis TaxID=1658108 RepID=UPI0006B489AF|nr:helix-turn-helix domain-containing protein [Niameybacter massiliensis]